MVPVSRGFYLKVLTGMLLLSLILYWQVIGLPFFSDDYPVMLRLSKGNFDTGIFLRPLGDFTLYLQYQLSGFNPLGYHLVNLLLHGCCGFLVVLLSLELSEYPGLKENRLVTAVLAGLLFTCYPMHAETVIWVIGRGILLSTACFLCSLIFFMKSRRLQVKRFRIWSLLFFVIALSGYETALVLPLVIFILCYYPDRRAAGALHIVLPYLVITLGYFILRYMVLPEGNGGDYFRTGNGIGFYLYNYAALVSRSFIPPSGTAVYFVGAMLSGVVIMMVLLWRLMKKNAGQFRQACLYLVLLLVLLLPVVTVGISTVDHEGGRFLYQPAVFTCLLVVILFTGNFFRTRLFLPLAAVLFSLSILLLVNVTGQWKIAGTAVEKAMSSLPVFSQPVLLTGAPDKIGSAYFFRNGLREACIIYGKGDWSGNVAGQTSPEGRDKGVIQDPAGAAAVLQPVLRYSYLNGVFVPGNQDK